MAKHIKSWFLFCYFFASFIISAQPDFRLVDSLISAGQFPITSFLAKQGFKHEDTTQFYEKYKLNLKGKKNHVEVSYFIENGNPGVVYSDSSMFTSLRYYSMKNDIKVLIPGIHLSFFYAYTYRRNSENYRYINFFIDHFIKNELDTVWTINDYCVNVKIFDDQKKLIKKLEFNRMKYPLNAEPEGGVLTGRNHLDLDLKIKTWNHFNPNIYQYTIEVLNKEDKSFESFYEKVGFRDLRMNQDEILINNVKLFIKAADLDPSRILEDSLEYCLKAIKVNNFNSIVIKKKYGKEIFDLCDSIGLNLIQWVNPDTFASLSDLLNYFASVKEHPSFIAWYDQGLNADWTEILKKLDHSRLLLKDEQSFNIIKNWHDLSNVDKLEAKKRFQTFNFYFVPDVSILKIEQTEFFKYSDKLAVSWFINKNDSVVRNGSISPIPIAKDVMEVKIPIDMNEYKSSEHSYQFKLVVTEDCYPYKKDDVIALSEFRYILRDGKLIYTADY